MRRFEAQVDGRRDGIRGEEGVGELEESIGSTVEAFVERVPEGAQSVESVRGFHGAPIMHSPAAFRILYLPAGLKRKLRACANRLATFRICRLSGRVNRLIIAR